MGPVFILNGNQDMFYCQENCDTGDVTANALQLFFPSASEKSIAGNISDTGHNINQHYSAPEAFTRMLDFVADNVK